MSLSISPIDPIALRSVAAPSATRTPRSNVETVGADTVSASIVATGNRIAQQTSALERVLGNYRADLPEGEPVAALSSLARQITEDASLSKGASPAAEMKGAPKAEVESTETIGGRLDTIL